VRLIDKWQEGWKLYSAWAWAFVLALPDLYNGMATMGWLDSMADTPNTLKWIIRGAAVVGLASRFISQTKPKPDDTDTAGA